MRLNPFRGWVDTTAVGIVGLLLIGLVLLTGSSVLPGAGAEPVEEAASSSPDEPNRGDADPNAQAPGPPTPPPANAIEAITPPLLVPAAEGQGGDAPAPSGSGPAGSGAGDPDLEAAVLALVNQERAAVGCPALLSDGPLTGLARAHSADMRDRNFFSHDNPSGQSPWDRAEAAGIGYLAAENIAAGQSSAAAVMAAWMGSAGHRANILNCSLRTLGVGVAYGGSYGIYWTQDFGG